MSTLFHFLTEIAIDPKKQEEFARDPMAMMETVRLSETDETALNSRDRVKITTVVTDELKTNEFMNIMGSCCWIDPGPDPLPDPDPPDEG